MLCTTSMCKVLSLSWYPELILSKLRHLSSIWNFLVLRFSNFLLLQVQVYDLRSMSCSYVLPGHSEIVLCLDTCVSSVGKVLIVTGSKDNSVSYCPSPSFSASCFLILKCSEEVKHLILLLLILLKHICALILFSVLLTSTTMSIGEVVGGRKQMLHWYWKWSYGSCWSSCLLKKAAELLC